jgi:hypothetical protein
VPVKGRRSIEGERAACLLPGQASLNRRVLEVFGAAVVLEQRLAVVASSLDERAHHAAMDSSDLVRSDVDGKHITNPIVIGLDPFRRAAAANETGGAQHGYKRLPLARDPACIADELGCHRPAADRQRLEEAPRLGREGPEPRREHLCKRGRMTRLRCVGARIPC